MCFDLLPDEIIVKIIGELNIQDFVSLIKTSHFFLRFGEDEYIWELLAQKKASDIFPYKPIQKGYKWLCLAKTGSRVETDQKIVYGNSIVTKDNRRDEKGACIRIEINKTNEGTKGKKILSGTFKEGELWGYGMCWWNNGQYYEGCWKRGVPHGWGKMIFPNGELYEGRWRNGKRSGKGIYKWKTGKYVGRFKDGHMEGEGTYIWDRGYCKGEWKRSKKDGEFLIVWDDGSKFKGKYKDGLREGPGECIRPSS